MKKITITFLILFFALSISFSQVEPDTTISNPSETEKVKNEKANKNEQFTFKKIYFGGSMGLSFGSYFRIALYPMIGYKFTPKLSGGVEVGYEYIVDDRYESKHNYSNYGASIFVRYRLIPQLYFHVEPAFYNLQLGSNPETATREWISFLFIGAGYSQRIAPNTWAFAQVKFDVLNDVNSPYYRWDPFWNVGVSVGF